MKRVLIITGLLFIIAAPAHAQELPPTATEGVQMVAAILAGLAGLLSTVVIDWIKSWPYLKDGDKSKLSGPAANLVSAVVSVGSGYLVGWLGQYAGALDQSGIWQVILFTWPAAKGWFEVQQTRRGLSK